jgi:hypothetical protein
MYCLTRAAKDTSLWKRTIALRAPPDWLLQYQKSQRSGLSKAAIFVFVECL